MSVRPILDIEDSVFQKMMEPFDPTREEVEQWVADSENRQENREENPENPDSEEASRPKTRAPPAKPSAEEVENHMATHLPFRDWCPHCVRGKSGSKAHKANQGMHEIPTVAVD